MPGNSRSSLHFCGEIRHPRHADKNRYASANKSPSPPVFIQKDREMDAAMPRAVTTEIEIYPDRIHMGGTYPPVVQ